MADLHELIRTFTKSAQRHHEATVEGNYKAANEAVDKINSTYNSLLENFSFEGRDALLPLTEDKNDAIALMALGYLLKYHTDHCIKLLKRLSKKPGLIGFSAAQAIKRWKSGEWNVG
jgi:hypothetical protein